MILPAGPLRIYIATRPVDFRKGMDGLAALAQAQLRLDRSQAWCWCSGPNALIG